MYVAGNIPSSPLRKKRKDNRLILLYKGLKGKARIPTDDLIPKTRRGRNQHSLAFQIPSASKDVYKYSFFPQTIRDWNDLPGFRDSSAQNHFGPGLLGPNGFFYWDSSARDSSARLLKCFICGIQWKTNVYQVCFFYFNIRFITIGKRNVKKESIFSYKQMYFLFHVGHLGPGHFGRSFLQPLIFSS